MPLVFFIIWRVIIFTIAFYAQKVIPPSGIFQLYLKPIDLYSHLPLFIQSFGNFDGFHYLHIAKFGYGMYQQAFFPFFPFLIYILSLVTNNFLISGLIISNASFLIGLLIFRNYLKSIAKNKKGIIWILIFLLFFPTSFFFGGVYTEGLFFLFIISSLYFLQKKKYFITAIFCILASLTRLMGFFMIIPLVFTLIEHRRISLSLKQLLAKEKKYILLVISPLIGLFIYMVYLGFTVGNPFAFYSSVSSFNTGRSTFVLISLPQVFYRYVNIFIHAKFDFIYFIAVVEFLMFNLVFWMLIYDLYILWKSKNVNRLHLIGLNLFSMINIILPTLTGTLTSIPRYELLSLSFFIRVGSMNNRIIKIVMIVLFFVLSVVLLSFFSQGYFIS